MKAIKPIQEGDEIFNDYGEIPRADLLRRYGYVTDNYAVYDVVELTLGDVCQSAGLSNSDVESQPRVGHVMYHMHMLHDLDEWGKRTKTNFLNSSSFLRSMISSRMVT